MVVSVFLGEWMHPKNSKKTSTLRGLTSSEVSQPPNQRTYHQAVDAYAIDVPYLVVLVKSMLRCCPNGVVVMKGVLLVISLNLVFS